MLNRNTLNPWPASVRDWPASRRLYVALLAVLFVAGVAFRLYRFTSVPAGMQQDELSEAYESFCLLKTAADRWGIHLPVYFLGWGSGQNVLQAYLTVPVVAVLGLTPLAARLVTLVCSLLSLPLFFSLVRRWHGEVAGMASLLFLCVCPWHIMLSRWGLECNPLPFFLLLGLFTFERGVRSRSAWLIVPSLVPFALAFYAYGIVLVFLPLLLPLFAMMEWRKILERKRAWLGALAVGLAVTFPFACFVLKNYVTKRNYGFERWLPFSVPLMPVSRLGEIRSGGLMLHHNAGFLLRGLQDQSSWNQVPGIRPLPILVLALACLGIASTAARVLRERKFDEPFLPWLLAALPVLLIVPVKINEAICLFLPLLALAGTGFVVLLDRMRTQRAKTVTAAVCGVLLVGSTVNFAVRYFGPIYARASAPTFHPTLPTALDQVDRLAGPGEPVYISESILLNYVQVLFYRRIEPRVYQASGATWDHPEFGPYRFSRTSLAGVQGPFVYLLSPGDAAVCAGPVQTSTVGEFQLGECR